MLSHVETLPAEIQTLLLCWLPDTSSLWSLLRTSRVFLQVYRKTRNTIYTNVVCNQIGVRLVPVVLAILKLRKLVEPVDVDMFLEVIKDLEDERDSLDVSTLSIQVVKELFQFHRVSDDLAQDFARESLLFLHSLPTLKATTFGETDTELSSFEHRRILRGLYHWELLALIGQQYMPAIEKDPSSATRFLSCYKSFASTLAIHELGEIQFVLYYIRERLSRYMDQAEEDRFEEFIDRGPGLPRFMWEYDADDMFFSQVMRSRQDDWISTMLWSRDLRAVCDICNLSTPEARLNFIEDTDSSVLEYPNPLAKVLDQYERSSLATFTSSATFADWKIPGKASLQMRISHYKETCAGSNLGLLWAHSDTRTQPKYDLLSKISGLGLVIWDKERLQAMEVYTSNWQFLLYSDAESFFVRRTNKPSVEERADKQELKWKLEGKTQT